MVAIGGSSLAFYWLLRSYLGLPSLFVTTVTIMAAVLCLLAAMYGYYIGYVRHWTGGSPEALKRIEVFERRSRILTFGVLAFLPPALALTSFRQNVTVGVLLLIMSAAVCPWALREIAHERRRR
jgi:hypothetical protein